MLLAESVKQHLRLSMAYVGSSQFLDFVVFEVGMCLYACTFLEVTFAFGFDLGFYFAFCFTSPTTSVVEEVTSSFGLSFVLSLISTTSI